MTKHALEAVESLLSTKPVYGYAASFLSVLTGLMGFVTSVFVQHVTELTAIVAFVGVNLGVVVAIYTIRVHRATLAKIRAEMQQMGK